MPLAGPIGESGEEEGTLQSSDNPFGTRLSPMCPVRSRYPCVRAVQLKSLARRKGFEPLTPRFEVWCSIQLSYRRSRRDRVTSIRDHRQPFPAGRRPKALNCSGPRTFILGSPMNLS
jgi:hypothetical protein